MGAGGMGAGGMGAGGMGAGGMGAGGGGMGGGGGGGTGSGTNVPVEFEDDDDDSNLFSESNRVCNAINTKFSQIRILKQHLNIHPVFYFIYLYM
jgi:hypothetical protein